MSVLDFAVADECQSLNNTGESAAISIGPVILPPMPQPVSAFTATVVAHLASIAGKNQAYIPIIDDGSDVVVGFGFMGRYSDRNSNIN